MSEDPKTRLMNAAGPIFAEKGFRRATVREICQAAGVNLAGVNYYFGGKERLYIETVKQARNRRVAQAPLPKRTPGDDPKKQLREFIRVLLTRMLSIETVPWESRLMLREMLQPSKACEEIAKEHLRPEFELLISILDELTPEGTPQYKLQQLGFSVVGQCLFYRVANQVVQSLVGQADLDGHFTVDSLADHICDLMLKALEQTCSSHAEERAGGLQEPAVESDR